MAEAGNEAQVRSIHWLTAGGRACCTLSQKGEEVFQNCAAYGLYPTAMPDGPLRRLAERYWPLFALGRGKQWIFYPRALELPAGTKGNVYCLRLAGDLPGPDPQGVGCRPRGQPGSRGCFCERDHRGGRRGRSALLRKPRPFYFRAYFTPIRQTP
jgi:hypothetical protein